MQHFIGNGILRYFSTSKTVDHISPSSIDIRTLITHQGGKAHAGAFHLVENFLFGDGGRAFLEDLLESPGDVRHFEKRKHRKPPEEAILLEAGWKTDDIR